MVPAQIAPVGDAVMATLAVTLVFTVMVMEFEVAGFPVAQARLEVITHLITSPVTRPLAVKVEELVPIFTLFFFHW